MMRKHREEGRRWEPVSCPFCEETCRRPEALDAVLETLGGRCSCGALFVADDGGSRGGQALVDGLTLFCEGDLERAMALVEGRDYELREIVYDPRTYSVVSPMPGRGRNVQPKIFFLRALTL